MATAIDQLITPDIARPARYLGNELGAVHKDWQSTAIRWVLTYPEIYEVGASNLGHIILYSIINQQPRQLCDRAYLPGADLVQKLKDSGTPLFAVESRRHLIDFDILGFSLSYELGATNILEMLSLAGIPLTWQERHSEEPWDAASWPMIFAGGQTATSNPEPYADFFDFIALGDGEELLPEIGLVLEEGKAAGMSRQEILLDLAQVPGVYVPQFYYMAEDGSVHPNRDAVPPKVLRRVATPIPDYSIGLVPHVQTVHDRLTIEIRRGCTRGCRFCQPGMLTRPARDVAPEQVVDTIERGMRATGYNEFSLLSLSCSDYLALPAVGVEVKNRLKNDNVSLSLPSQRVDRFDENIAHIVGGTRKTGLTFAPEAGTQRMRDIINKGLTNEELLRGVKTAHEQGWDKVKLYFMIGLPGETDADVLGIAETVQWLRRECRMKGRRSLNFNITVSNFTPKPHTPFQWHSVSTSEFERKQVMLKEVFRSIRGVKVNFTDVRISAMEDFVGRGDRRLAPVVKRAWELGAGMDAWWESLERAFNAWTQAIDDAGLTWKYRQVAAGEWNIGESLEQELSAPEAADRWQAAMDAPLPWDHLDTGIDKGWLQEDLRRALAAAVVPDCSFEGCSHCGVCGTDFGHNVVVPPLPIPTFEGHSKPKSDRVQRLRITLGKLGDMSLIGHLDLARMLDRAVRRAALPISFTGGYHPGPRIAPANALPLGATSSGEVVDFELTETTDADSFRQLLQAQLTDSLPIYDVQIVDLKAPSATRALAAADYLLAFGTSDGLATSAWQQWVDKILSQAEILATHTTKSGKVKQINLRERLHQLEMVTELPAHLPSSVKQKLIASGDVVVRYVGSCRNDGNMLRPEQVLRMFEMQQPGDGDHTIALGHVHRQTLMLEEGTQS
ncbi:TIGR03960 family B12-binding radical SAM protein [Leptothoe kymatousa]|uniref:TIGR03960 family B12-binding radical SAM protein n=1 Tax=Leptothoe kymatousa TAU-MAC 1615 TaxID=2364775 RepID=A0ABS5Y7E3_9CYAN|nr:TIGR03960 family B12-binding radical SAM protein [Leptothoe kymatousa]MBT9313289.1 TIGR03960 family B12-binding radical SAM protein [Leptothoe kymatousa TAU-MAC 1615]